MQHSESTPDNTPASDPGTAQPKLGATSTHKPVLIKKSPSRPWLPDIYLAIILLASFAIDQLTKTWVRANMHLGDSIPSEGLFRLTHTYNTGSAFNLFPNQTTLITLASLLGIAILLFILQKEDIPGIWLRSSLGLQLGGASGNLVDRITLGRVTDFIDIGIWPVFNLADSSIMIGLSIMIWFILLRPHHKISREATLETSFAPKHPKINDASTSPPNDNTFQ
jgi:signal peptidase II